MAKHDAGAIPQHAHWHDKLLAVLDFDVHDEFTVGTEHLCYQIGPAVFDTFVFGADDLRMVNLQVQQHPRNIDGNAFNNYFRDDVFVAHSRLVSHIPVCLQSMRNTMVKSKRRSMRVKPARVVAALAVMAATFNCCAGVGIATDGSAGVHQTIAGANAGAGNFSIPQTLGSLAGNNLFHSFSTFNIDTGQIATFTTTTPAIGNVISRVTGGGLSQINGLLKLTPVSGVPNFFFINPAGVAFGAGGSIDAPGAFHVSTADYVKFANGDKFYADLSKTSVLSSAAPEAFGFLGTTRAAITIRDGATLTTKAFQPISITSGDIKINNARVRSVQGGDIRVVALGNKVQEIGLTGTLPTTVDGDLSILNGGHIFSNTSSLNNAGTVKVSAGSIAIDRQGGAWTGIASDALNNANNAGKTGDAGSIDITASGVLSIVNGGEISSSTFSSGKAGSLDITASGALSIVNGGQINSSTYSSGKAGTVKVSAGSIAIDAQGGAWTGIDSQAVGNTANAGKTGDAGSVDITANGTLSIVNGGQISSSTYSSGKAGTVKVSAGSIAIDAQGSALTHL